MDKNTLIAIIAVAAVVVILFLIVVLLVLKKKGNKTETETILTGKEIISANTQRVEELLVYAEGDAGLTEALTLLQDKLKYLSPSTEEKVKSIDEKIKATLGDLKIELARSKRDDKNHIKEVELLIAERSVYTKG